MNSQPCQTLVLLGSVSQRLSIAAPAELFFTSLWAAKAKLWAQAHVQRGDALAWAFLCPMKPAVYEPRQIVRPFRDNLLGLPIEDKVALASTACEEVLEQGVEKVWLLAGKQFREYLTSMLVAGGVKVFEPLARMNIGRQLQWLGGTMEIDLKALEQELVAMTDEEAREEMQKIQSTSGSKERQKSQRELLAELRRQLASGDITEEELFGQKA